MLMYSAKHFLKSGQHILLTMLFSALIKYSKLSMNMYMSMITFFIWNFSWSGKAFNMIEHNFNDILIDKLKCYEEGGMDEGWFITYLLVIGNGLPL